MKKELLGVGKLNRPPKQTTSHWRNIFYSLIGLMALLFSSNVNAQTTVSTTLSVPTANSYGSQWATATAYKVNDLVYHTDGTTIRVWKVTTAGTSVVAPTSTADFGLGALAGVVVAGTGGQFSCTAVTGTTGLVVGNKITIAGTNTGTGSITGYTTGKIYTISATNGTTTFTLTDNGTAITTAVNTGGTTTGLTFSGVAYYYLGTVTQATSTWLCPTGVTSIDVELWGGGGAGGSASTAGTSTRTAGGGGAGSYVKKTLAVTPGTTYNVVVGGGGYPGQTTGASGYFGLCGGKSQFSGSGISTLTASGGTGGSGSGILNQTSAAGGVLGGVYGYSITGTNVTNYRKTVTVASTSITGTAGQFSTTTTTMDVKIGSIIQINGTITGTGSISGYVSGKNYYVIAASNGATSTFTISETLGGPAVTTVAGTLTGASTIYNFPFGTVSGGGGSGAVVSLPNSGTSIAYVASLNQGTGYTSNATVTYNIGSGYTIEGFVNPNINSAGDTVTLGSNGGDSTTTTSGAGGANAQNEAGGAGGTGTVTGGFVGSNGAAVGSGGGGGMSYYSVSGTQNSAKGGSGANGQIKITYTAPIVTYTYDGSGDLHDVANWQDELLNAPANFTADFQIFKINSNATTTGAWTVSGASSKIVVGDSTHTGVSLIIANGFGITGTLDVTNGNKVYDRNLVATEITSTTPSTYTYAFATTYGTLEDTSEVHYQNNDINSVLIKTAYNYGKLYVDGTGTGNVFFSGVGTTNHYVKTYFEVAENSIAQFSETSTYYLSIKSGASAAIYGTVRVGKAVGFVSSSVGTAGSTYGAIQFLGAESLTLGANSTIEYSRGASGTTQNVTPRTDYKNLTLSGADNNKSFTGATTVSGTLTLNITGTSTSTLAANVTVNGAITFTAGKITTSTNTLTLGTSATISGAGTGWVVGNLKKLTASGNSPSFTYAIGSATSYTPLALTFSGTTSAAGGLTAKTTSGDHASIAGSGLNSAKSLNRTWTLTNDALADFGTYDAAFTYATADNDAGTTPANYAVRLYNGSTWSIVTTSGTTTDAAASTTGISGFGDFVIGECTPTTTGSVTTSICAGATYVWPANGESYTTSQSNVQVVLGCNTATLNLTVNPNLTPTFTAVADICYGGSLSALPTTSNNGITGTWLPALNNTATTEYTFTPTAGQCGTTTTLTITVNALPEAPSVLCYQTATWNGATCSYDVTGTQPTEPAHANCWDTYTFVGGTTCDWVNNNTPQPTQPSNVNCWDDYQFVGGATCNWVNVGSQPAQPTNLACYESVGTFNTGTCQWNIVGELPAQPTNLACYESVGTFNTGTCQWNIVNAQPAQPSNVNCWDDYQFVGGETCNWVNVGSQPAQPTNLACYESVGTFNTGTCQWNIVGEQPAQPTNLACYESVGTFNTGTCQWNIVGTQPAAPTVACYQTATWNATTCDYDVTGSQPAQPTNLACYESVGTFNTGTCQWNILGTAPALPQAGTDGTLSVDSTPTNTQLFAALTGADEGGSWTHPAVGFVGVHTYTVTQAAPCSLSDSATVTVSLSTEIPTGPLSFCKGATVATAVGSTSLKFYTAQSGTAGPLATTTALTTKNYYVTETINNNESSSRVLVAVTVNTLPATIATLTTSDDVLCKHIGTENEVTYTAASGASSYVWTVPAGVSIVGGQGTNALTVNFSTATLGFVGTLGNIGVKAVDANSCISATAKTIVLKTKLPVAPTSLKLSSTGLGEDIKKVGPYMGTETVFTLTAPAAATAASYSWTLPNGVNQLNGGNSNVITVDFYNVGQGIGSLPIVVKSKGGCGESTARTLTLARVLPAKPSVLVLNDDAISDVTAVTKVGPYTGKETPLTLRATPASTLGATATSFKWVLPEGVIVTSGALTNDLELDGIGTRTVTSTSSALTVNLSGIQTAVLSIPVSIYAVNGAGISLAKTLTLTAAVPATPAIVGSGGTGTSAQFSNCLTKTYTATLIPGATYAWTIPAGATIVGDNDGNVIEVDYSTTSVALNGSSAVTCTAINGTGPSITKSLTVKRVACPARIAPEAAANGFSVKAYPNPSSSTFTIETSAKGAINAKVYDMQGRLVENANSTQVGSRLAAGVYNVIVSQGANTKSVRVIKQ